MDLIYLVVLGGALLATAASVVSAVRSVARQPAWTLDVVPRTSFDVAPQAADQRRTQSLPFVGRERRAAESVVEETVDTVDATPQRLAA